MGPDKDMTGAIKQPAGGARDPAHQHIEMMSRNGAIVRSSDHKRRRCYLFQPERLLWGLRSRRRH